MLDKIKFIEAKTQGKNNTEAALEAGAKNKKAAKQAGYRISKTPVVKTKLEKTFKKAGMDDRVMVDIIMEAARAEKMNQFTGEIAPDYNTRLRAAKMYYDIKRDQKPAIIQAPSQTDNKALLAAIRSNDDVELQRIILNKKTD